MGMWDKYITQSNTIKYKKTVFLGKRHSVQLGTDADVWPHGGTITQASWRFLWKHAFIPPP
jgi:hypothetical protein